MPVINVIKHNSQIRLMICKELYIYRGKCHRSLKINICNWSKFVQVCQLLWSFANRLPAGLKMWHHLFKTIIPRVLLGWFVSGGNMPSKSREPDSKDIYVASLTQGKRDWKELSNERSFAVFLVPAAGPSGSRVDNEKGHRVTDKCRIASAHHLIYSISSIIRG